MFAGHLGAALLIGRVERRVNIGVFIAAALLLDAVLWILVLSGWESVAIPADFRATHQVRFIFPYSHGLAAAIAWSSFAAILAGVAWSRRAAMLIAAAVFSHWLLDALVHRPELPLAGAGSLRVGLGLWENLPLALAVEALIVGLGLCLFLPNSLTSRGRSLGLAALALAVLAFTAAGMTIAPPPPSAFAMAASSLATLIVVCALSCWLGRLPAAPR